MDITNLHVTEINAWLQGSLPQPETHVLHDWDGDWMLYGTGTAQLSYLAVLDAVAEIFLGIEQGPVGKQRVLFRRSQVSGNKDVLPNVSNYWIQFKKSTVAIVRTGDPAKPIRLAGGDFKTLDSLDFFESFNDSVFSLNDASLSKIVSGLKKHDENAPDRPKLRDKNVHNMMRMYAVRRACKFLLYESIGDGKSIRYALDDLNLEMAGRRARVEGKVPVCTTELREVFRYWDYFQRHVTFYKDFRRVAPPWETPTATPAAVQAWANYAGHRANKILSSNAAALDARVVADLEDCIDAINKGRFAEAIRLFHRSRPSVNGKFLKSVVHGVSVLPEL